MKGTSQSTEITQQTEPSGRMIDPSSQRMIKPDGFNKALYDSMYSKSKKPSAPYIDYSSVQNLTQENKIQFLKRKDFDPTKLEDPRDEINVWMNRWKDYSSNMQKHLLDYKGGQKTQNAVAAQFYDLYLAPAYKRMGQPPMDRSAWIRNAYEIGQHYDLDYNYSNHVTYGIRTGEYSLGALAARAAKTITTLAGAFISPPKPITDENWQKQLNDARKSGQKPEGFWQNAEALASTNRVFNYQAARQRLNNVAERMDIMQQLRPMRGFTEKAASFATENAPFLALAFLAPPAAAESEFTSLGLEGVTQVGAEAETGLAENILSSTKALVGNGIRGKMAEAALRAGAEGLLYGGLTRDTNEKNKAFEDALMWSVGAAGITGITSVGGKLIQSIGSKFFDRGAAKDYGPIDTSPWPWEQKKLTAGPMEGEYVGEPPIGQLTPEMQAAQNTVTQQQKMLADGRSPATAHDYQELSEAGVAETVAEHGGAAQEFINNTAAAHLIRMEESGRTLEQIRQYEKNLFDTGTREDKDMLDAVARIRGALKDRVITNLSKDEKANLIMHLQNLTQNASQKMLKYLPGLQQALRQRITSYPTGKLDQDLIKHLLPDVMKALPPDAKPEQIANAIKNKLADATIAMHKFADEQVTRDYKIKAQDAEQKRSAFVKKNKAPAGFSEITRRTKSAKGEPGVSYSVNPQWIVYAKNAIKKSGRKWNSSDIKNWLEDLSTDDFAADIHGYFLPKFIKDADIRFERRGSAGKGYDYSNLFAFAWNFKNKMPTEYAERLEEELTHSPKMQGFYDQIRQNKALTPAMKKKATDSLIWRQSKAMWNHVDNFLNSGHFPKESHIFGSTNSFADDPTIWMEQLFNEREQYENKVVDAMYKRGTTANKNAKAMIKVMMADRRKAYKEGGLEKVKQISIALKSKLLEPGPRGGKSKAEGKIIPLQERVVHEVPNPYNPRDVQAMVAYQKEAMPLKYEIRNLEQKYNYWADRRDQNPLGMVRQTATREAQRYYDLLAEAHEKHEALRDKYRVQDLNVPQLISKGPLGSVTIDKQGRPAVWLNKDMMSKFYMAVKGKSAEYGVGVLGFNVSRRAATAIIKRIEGSFKLGMHDSDLLVDLVRRGFDKAGPEGPTFMQLDRSTETMLDTYHEEITHGWQRNLGARVAHILDADEVKAHLNRDSIKKLIPLIPQKLKAYIDHNYPLDNYNNDQALYENAHVVEAAAKLIAQGPEGYYSEFKGRIPEEEANQRFALGEEESIKFLKAYYDEIIATHGDDALDSLTTATSHAEKIRRDYLESRGRKVTESTRITEEDIPYTRGASGSP